jgi:hypothetical protein
VLVPIRLTGGYTVTFGAWLGVHPDDLRRAFDVWWTQDYTGLQLEGRLANMLPPWESDTYARPLVAVVPNPDEVPYADSSSDESMQNVPGREWPHDAVLAAIARFDRA